MRKAVAVLAVFALLVICVPSQTSQVETRHEAPADFKGDGCSLWPDGDYRQCCEAHDRDYYRGGTGSERKASDKRLRDCVRAKGHKYLAPLMYVGVRIAGVSWLPTPFRWGFGQKKPKRKTDYWPLPSFSRSNCSSMSRASSESNSKAFCSSAPAPIPE